MSQLSLKKHYEKKYPGGRVFISDSAVDVYNSNGEHVVALRKDGHGNMVCRSEEFGTMDRHDLAPMPGCPGYHGEEIAKEHFCTRSGKLKSGKELEMKLKKIE